MPRPIDFTTPTSPEGRPTDQPEEVLNDVASEGQVVVAAGEDFSDNVTPALFLTSTDGGAHFSRVNPGSTGSTNEGASHLAAGRKGFLASGVSAHVAQLWSSADSRQWRRITVPSGVFNSEDTIDAITETVQGWLLTDTHSGQVGAGLADVITWTSTDGARWTRPALSRVGRPLPTGTASVSSVAADKATLVIAGGIEDDAARPNRTGSRSGGAPTQGSTGLRSHRARPGAAYRA